jgi:hypothetical protein
MVKSSNLKTIYGRHYIIFHGSGEVGSLDVDLIQGGLIK